MAVNAQSLKDQLDGFSSELKLELNPALPGDASVMQKGFRLYASSSIKFQRIDHTAISAAIELQSGALFNVQLDLDFPSFSNCTCEEESWCPHQIAVFFESYENLVSIQQWMEEWETGGKPVPESPASIPGVMRASDLLKNKQNKIQGPEGWVADIRLAAEERLPVPAIHKNPYILEYEGKKLYEILMKKQPSKREWQPLYQLFVSFTFFNFINELFKDKHVSPEVLNRSCSSFLYYLVEEAADAADEISVHAIPFEFDPYIQYLLADSKELLSQQEIFLIERIDLYRHLWASLFKREAWRKEEISRLEQLKQSESGIIFIIAYLHQLYITSELEAFEQAAEKLPRTNFDFFMYWLYDAFSQRQHHKALMLLRIADQKLEGYLQLITDSFKRRQFVHWFLNYIDTDWLISKEPVMYKRMLLRMLPYSYVNLSNHLLVTMQFNEWVELQLWMNYDLPELEAMGLKEVAKHAPEKVLPVYHHGVLMLVEQRSRDNYKKAVRYLKRMRTIYKKQKKMDRWEQYFTLLLNDTKRLRAFHEECRKGKLIDA